MASEVTVSAEAESAEASTLKPSEDVADERPGTPVEDEKNANDASGDAAAEDEDDSDEEENVNVVIKSNAATAPIGMVAAAQQSVTGQSAPGGAGPVFKGGVGQLSGIGTRVVQLKTGGVELDLIPSVNGVLLTEMDLETLEDKPWRLPGADISDYFNYGFNEETWGSYCSKQKLLRAESTARGLVVGNKLMSGNTVDHNAPKMIQTISRTDNFSEEQKNLLGLTSSVQSSVGDSIHHVNVISSISSTNGMPHNSIPKLNNDPGAMLPPPFMPPGMPPMPPPFGLPFPGMPGGPGGFPGMPPGFPAFPPAAAIPNKMPENEIECKTEPLSSPPDVYEQDRDDDIQMTKEHKRRDRERDHSPRERESRKRHHRDRDRSEEKGGGGGSGRRSGRGRHNSEEDPGASDEKAGRSYKRSSKKHHKEHYRERDYRSRSRDRTPTNDE